MKIAKAQEIDNIKPKMMKFMVDFGINMFYDLLNLIEENSGRMEPCNYHNYRGISLLSCRQSLRKDT